MDAGILSAAISTVCPVNSVKVGKNDDRATWSFDPAVGATPAQITAANNVIATIGIAVLSVVKFDAFIARWTDPEYALLMQRRAQAIGAGNVTLVKQWDIAAVQGQVDLNSPAAQNFKAAIVSAGILSQARADVIFN
jgi:hypothetical protein